MTLIAAWLPLLCPGCGSSPSSTDFATTEAEATASDRSASNSSEVFDFGPILAHGQTLRHQFTLTNPTDKPIRLLQATCFMPCCSAIESLPKFIPPHGDSKVSVVFKPGHQSGHKAVRFAVQTDSTDQPTRALALLARLFSAWEVGPIGEPVGTTRVGSSGTASWRAVCRRKESEGLSPPERLKIGEPFQARFIGPATEQTQPDGVVEAIRDVEIYVPATLKPGPQQVELAFLWPDGRRETQLIRWEVTPVVRISPSSIVIEQAGKPVERSVTITSDEKPFRIIQVGGGPLSGPVEPSPIADRIHHLTLRLDPARAVAGGVSNVVIRTDHPLHSELTVRVLALPSQKGKGGAS
jgi:hypothetical protein